MEPILLRGVYSGIVDIIDAARSAGVDRLGIVTEGMRRAAGAI